MQLGMVMVVCCISPSGFSGKNYIFCIIIMLIQKRMSLAPKFLSSPNTWLSFYHRNRISGSHGRDGLFIKNNIQFKPLLQLHCDVFEALWVWLRLARLLHGLPCVVVGTIYHPPCTNDCAILDYLSTSLITVKSLYAVR